MSSSRRSYALLALGALAVTSRSFAADPFTAAPIVFNTNGGWSWFSDSRAIIVNNQVILGTIAGFTGNGSTGGDVDVTSYNLTTHALTETLLHSALEQDDHDDPAFTVLPDGRIMVLYQTHGSTNDTLWRVSTSAGETTSWNPEQTSVVNVTNDGNGNTYANPFYLSVPNEVVSASRAIGYDPNYSVFTNLTNTTPTFTYGGHWMYWKNPNTGGALTGGNGRPYLKYASNGTDRIWFATTEDSPQNYLNSLYCGYMQFTNTGAGSVYTSTGTLLGGLSTGTAPTGGSNPPTSGNAGDITSGTGKSYLPTDFTPIVKANAVYNGVDLTGKYVGWASSMQLDSAGDPYVGFVVVDNTTGAYGNDLEYYYAHFDGASWQVHRVGYAGLPLYNGQNQYAGLMTVDPLDPNRIFISSDVDPVTKASLLGPDGKQHWQIFEGNSTDGGATWGWTQLTDTASDNLRPVATSNPDGTEALAWERGTYTSYTSWNTSMVAVVVPTSSVSVTWNSTSSSAWDVAGTANWFNGGSQATFFNGNLVTFSDGAGLQSNVVLNAAVTPASISVTANGVNYTISGSGTIAGSGGLTKSGNSTLTISTANSYAGGTSVSGGKLIVGNYQALGTGPIAIHAGATVQLQAGLAKAVLTPSLTFDGSVGAWSGTLDLTNNKLIVESVSKATDLANLRSQNGSAIVSSTLPANFGIAIVDNAALAMPFATFGGQAVDANSILISAELLGDTNLDGHVDLTDLSTVLNNFGASTLAWSSGNFDNAATIDLTDLSAVLNNFGLTNAGASGGVFNAAPVGAPEPATVCALGCTAVAVLVRRRERS
jgi:autotransporter-associated beta strand protein